MKQAECIIFPDIHGRDFWKSALDGDCGWTAPRLIFLGDYFDPYSFEGITTDDAIRNWSELHMALQKHTCEEIVWIAGNHDAHYLNETFCQLACGSRFDYFHQDQIRRLLSEVPLQIAYEMNINGKRILFTHAGVTSAWSQEHNGLIASVSVESLNKLTQSEQGWTALSDISFYRGGRQQYGGPLWADSREFTLNNLKGIDYDMQIVGHNQLMGDVPETHCNVIDLDCHHPFAITSELNLIKL